MKTLYGQNLIHEDGEWILASGHDRDIYTYYINHECGDNTLWEKEGCSGWGRQYFYYDDVVWKCRICHETCPKGLQALLILMTMDYLAV